MATPHEFGFPALLPLSTGYNHYEDLVGFLSVGVGFFSSFEVWVKTLFYLRFNMWQQHSGIKCFVTIIQKLVQGSHKSPSSLTDIFNDASSPSGYGQEQRMPITKVSACPQHDNGALSL